MDPLFHHPQMAFIPSLYTLYIAALSFQNGSSISPSSNGFYTFSLYLIHSCFIFSKWMLYLHKLAALSFQIECFITYKWLLYSLKMASLSFQNSCISLSKWPLLSNEFVTFSYQSCFLFARIVQLLSFHKISLSAQLPSCSVSMKMPF